MDKKEIISKLKQEIKSLRKQEESAKNFGWMGRGMIASHNFDFFKSIYEIITGKKHE